MTKALLILNGKKAGLPEIRQAVTKLREAGNPIDVRVTWEAGDVKRFVDEAITRNIDRIIIGGGDGSINEVANAILNKSCEVPALGILPLGTANDFATGCNIPVAPEEALQLALNGDPVSIDAAQANEHFFLNVASIGFGAEVTVNTPVALKNFLGGGAYSISGLVQALNFKPYESRVFTQDKDFSSQLLIAAACNGRTAGGGQALAPTAFINDGLLDILIINAFSATDVPEVLQELKNTDGDGEFIQRMKIEWIEGNSERSIPINLDGEPFAANRVRISVVPKAISVILPPDCPCII